MRIILCAPLGVRNPDSLHHLDSFAPCLFSRRSFVQLDCFGNLIAYSVNGIERGHWILKDHRDLPPSQTTHLFVVEFHQIAAGKYDLALCDPSRRRNQSHYRETCDGFAAAGFADKRECRACFDPEAHVICRFDGAGPCEEVRAKVFDCEDVLGHLGFAGNLTWLAGLARIFTAHFRILRRKGDAIIDIGQSQLTPYRLDYEMPVQSLINLVAPIAVALAGVVLDDRSRL